MTERHLHGIAAAPGLVAGRFRRIEAGVAAQTAMPSGGADALKAALQRATEELTLLLASCNEAESEILAMQVAFIEDDALSAPAFAAIASGLDAAAAWRGALDTEIEGYRSAGDDYFRARAVDFEDIRDRVLAILAGHVGGERDVPADTIVVAHDLKPSQFLAARWAPGTAVTLVAGSPTSHVAMLARGRGVAMVVGLGEALFAAEGEAIVDGASGRVLLAPTAERLDEVRRLQREFTSRERDDHAAYAARPARTRDGTVVEVYFNIADPGELDGLDPASCSGIGLVRTELFVDDMALLRDEEFQYRAYRRIAEWAQGKPVTFRTLDAGGDKPLDGYTRAGEQNPFLGMRGIRLSLANESLFRIQLRALARAAAHGAVKVMLPMVTVPHEFDVARRLLAQEVAVLAARGTPHALPPLGIMVEVPATAIVPERFDADFFSIGSNDLVQYVCAASRGEAECAVLAQIADPAVLRLIANVVEHGRQVGREVSLCGDAASESASLPLLLHAGLRRLSMQPALAGAVKASIAGIDLAR